ncbi:hypothetical protein D3C77_471690 [compost metagenome]
MQVLFDLAVDATQLRAKFIQLLLQRVDCLLGVVLFVLIMAAQALQQRFRLVIRMFLAAAHRAGLIILKLRPQFFDALAAGQALAFEQLPGNRQGLFGSGQLVLAVEAGTDQLSALFEGRLLALAQGSLTLFQGLLLLP